MLNLLLERFSHSLLQLSRLKKTRRLLIMSMCFDGRFPMVLTNDGGAYARRGECIPVARPCARSPSSARTGELSYERPRRLFRVQSFSCGSNG